MEKRLGSFLLPIGSIIVLALLATGCATKKFVRNSIEPLETRLGKTEEQVGENSRKITEVDQNAKAGIGEAKEEAKTAAQGATQADKHAQDAQALAEKGLNETDSIRHELRNADNFQLLKSETILFDFGKSELNEDGIHALDQLASVAQSAKRYVIEVQGFTDRVGSEGFNLELSRRRAESVVRYLTLTHKLPLARVFEMGYGEEQPAAPNDTSDGRKQNRRVEVRILAVQQAGGQAQASNSGN